MQLQAGLHTEDWLLDDTLSVLLAGMLQPCSQLGRPLLLGPGWVLQVQLHMPNTVSCCAASRTCIMAFEAATRHVQVASRYAD